MNELEAAVERLGGIESAVGGKVFPMRKRELYALEKKLGVSLPAMYRELLLKYGASSFNEAVLYRPVEKLRRSSEIGVFSCFYGPARKAYPETVTLKWHIDTLTGRMPDTVIPIGPAAMGDQICLGIRANEAGKVFHWDHENEWDKQEYIDAGEPVPPDLEFQNVSLIAHSFEDFLNRMQVDEG